MIVMNAATSAITTKSPYIVRVSFTLPQVTAPIAEWAAKNKHQEGLHAGQRLRPRPRRRGDVQEGVHGERRRGGRRAARSAARTRSSRRSIQRIKDAKPEAVFIFTPAGETAVAFMKAFSERGLDKAGIKLIATGDVTDDDVHRRDGRRRAGRHHDPSLFGRPQVARERRLQEGVRRRRGTRARGPTSWRWAAGTGCTSSTRSPRSSAGDIDGDKAMAATKGMTIESPRGHDRDRSRDARRGPGRLRSQGPEDRREATSTSSSTRSPRSRTPASRSRR